MAGSVSVGEKITAAWGNDVVSELGLTGARVQAGSVTVVIVSGSTGTATVTFAVPFSGTPAVVCQPVSGSGGAIKSTLLVTARSATQFTVRYELNAPTASGINWPVDWIAVGP